MVGLNLVEIWMVVGWEYGLGCGVDNCDGEGGRERRGAFGFGYYMLPCVPSTKSKNGPHQPLICHVGYFVYLWTERVTLNFVTKCKGKIETKKFTRTKMKR